MRPSQQRTVGGHNGHICIRSWFGRVRQELDWGNPDRSFGVAQDRLVGPYKRSILSEIQFVRRVIPTGH